MKLVGITLTLSFALLNTSVSNAATERHETGLTLMADANAASNMALAREFAKLEKKFDKAKESGEIEKNEKPEIKALRKKIREKLAALRVRGWDSGLAAKIQKNLKRYAKMIKKARKKTEVVAQPTGTATPAVAETDPGTGVTPIEGAIEIPTDLTATNGNLAGEITEDELDAQLSQVVDGGAPDAADLKKDDEFSRPGRMPAVAAGLQ